LFTHAVEFLREHVPEKTRIHYILRGGSAPNIVPDSAEVFLYARHPSMLDLDGIWKRILKCAEAGALATETTYEVEFIDSSYHTLPNEALAGLVDRNLRRVGGVTYTAEETSFAETLWKTYAGASTPAVGSQEKIQPPAEGTGAASTDAGDVSWAVPMSQLVTATYPPGTPGHSWQSAAVSGTSIGRKGMKVAAQTLALSAMDLFTDPAAVVAARASFDRRRAGQTYQSRVPEGHGPPLNYRDNK
jgi:aminobenzoyl-glutamate utilization protein B